MKQRSSKLRRVVNGTLHNNGFVTDVIDDMSNALSLILALDLMQHSSFRIAIIRSQSVHSLVGSVLRAQIQRGTYVRYCTIQLFVYGDSI